MRRKQSESRSVLRIVLVFLLCAAVLFAAAILLGNFLKSLSEDGPFPASSKTPEKEEGQTGYFNAAQVPVILGEYYSPGSAGNIASGAVDSGAASSPVRYNAVTLTLRTKEIASVPAQTTAAVTKKSTSAKNTETAAAETAPSPLRKTGMQLHYTSEFAALEPFDTPGTRNAALLLGEAKQKYGYVSGLFEIMFFTEPAVTRSLIREYEISLLAELSDCGLDDAVLTGVPETAIPDVIAFIRDVNTRTNGRLKLGIALTFDYFEASNIKNRINALHYDCGFFAIDLRGESVPTLMTYPNFVYDRIGRIASTVSLYSIRVLVGLGDAAEYRAEAEAAFKAGALNIMAAPLPDTANGG